MATVLASNGQYYHLWGLPDMSSPEAGDEIDYSTLENELMDGYRSSVFTGFTAGTRSWKLSLPTLASLEVLSKTVTDVTGAAVSREHYIRNLFVDNQASGRPFVFLSVSNNTYHFVDFEDEELTLSRIRVKIFSTGIRIKERRLSGITLPAP